MRNILFFIASTIFALSSSAAFAEPLAYPGSAWAVVTTPSIIKDNGPEAGNWTFDGKAEQGIDWLKFGKDNKWTLDTYLTVSLRFDSKGFDYNNRVAPGIGVKISRPIKNGVLEIGLEAINETRFGTKYRLPDRSGNAIQGYVSYWVGWGR